MWYVYMKHIGTGREEFVGIYNTPKEAVCKMRNAIGSIGTRASVVNTITL